MSLINVMTENFIILECAEESDGRGGYTTSYTDGDAFSGALTHERTKSTTEGGKRVISSNYTLTTTRDIELSFGDVFRRVSDDKTFRVTSDGDDRFTPSSACLDMRQVDCEEWILPEDEEND